MIEERRPRHYADEIIRLRTREERRDALAKVPEIFQSLVETHVRNHFSLQSFKRKQNERV